MSEEEKTAIEIADKIKAELGNDYTPLALKGAAQAITKAFEENKTVISDLKSAVSNTNSAITDLKDAVKHSSEKSEQLANKVRYLNWVIAIATGVYAVATIALVYVTWLGLH